MPESNPLQPGQRFGNGRFVLVRFLGRGGMGEVWLAQDERLHESVALKFLPSEIRGDPVALDDLRRETARSHKLTHPNIVRIHDLHEDPDGTAFIVMEYIDGPMLAALRLQQSNRVFAWDFLRPLLEQLCAALHYAHGEKVIHRDLKPANIMVDSNGRLKLADFGIAAVASDSISRVSAQHTTSGTLPYMSPQQLTGKRAQATDDIYALGATLYELLTSKPPFYTGDLTHQILREPPEPMDERLAALEIQNEIPPDAAALIMACLAKEPGQRPQSALVVAEWTGLEVVRKPSLEALSKDVFSDAPPDAGRPVTPEIESVAAARSSSGRKLPWAVGVFAAMLLLAAGGWYWAKHKPLDMARLPRGQTGGSSHALQQLDQQRTNSLGMIFVPMPGTKVLFSIWDTRVQDFTAFVKETGYDATQGMISELPNGREQVRGDSWMNPGFAQGPAYPVCGVSWDDAHVFCRWLTEKERHQGLLTRNQSYRLPTEAEWYAAVGSLVFPWGDEWPTPSWAGNYGGKSTSPVGSFSSNRFGLYDMGGNVWQPCEDWFDAQHQSHVAHGGSWHVEARKERRYANWRQESNPTFRNNVGGFRCVLAND
jgi:serine/threonine protein kinase